MFQRLLKSHQGRMISQITVRNQCIKKERSINQQQGNTLFQTQTQAAKSSQVSHLKKHVDSTLMKTSCTSALHANANASVHNA